MSKTIKLILILSVISTNYALGQNKEENLLTKNNIIMKTYVIERNIHGAGDLIAE